MSFLKVAAAEPIDWLLKLLEEKSIPERRPALPGRTFPREAALATGEVCGCLIRFKGKLLFVGSLRAPGVPGVGVRRCAKPLESRKAESACRRGQVLTTVGTSLKARGG